jgi:CRISPR-associated protein Cst2
MPNKISKNVVGFVLIDAPHSALNMGQADPSEANENKIPVKFVRRGREIYPYVSAQAWRYWWRNTLEANFGWQMSPIQRETKIAFTSANPFIYPDDDVFGYMRAMSNALGGTLTRLSPLKTSPLMSVLPQSPTTDFGSMSRHEGDPVLHEHQFYSTVFKGIFSLDISSIGVFQEVARTGFKNLDEKYVAKPEIQEAVKESRAEKGQDGTWKLPKETRIKRASDTIKALPFLSGGAKQTLHLTDVTPKFVVLAVIKGGNHLFMNIASNDPNSLINAQTLHEVISDYQNEILSDVFIGRQEGFQDNLRTALDDLQKALEGKKTIHLSSPKKAVEKFAEEIPKHIE